MDPDISEYPKMKTKQRECQLKSHDHPNTKAESTDHQESGNGTKNQGAQGKKVRDPKGHPAEHQLWIKCDEAQNKALQHSSSTTEPKQKAQVNQNDNETKNGQTTLIKGISIRKNQNQAWRESYTKSVQKLPALLKCQHPPAQRARAGQEGMNEQRNNTLYLPNNEGSHRQQ